MARGAEVRASRGPRAASGRRAPVRARVRGDLAAEARPGRRAGHLAGRRARRVRADARARPRRPDARRLHVHDRAGRARDAAAPGRPRASGSTINGARLWVAIGPLLVPAGGVRQGPDRHLPGVVPRGQARDARGRLGPVRAAARQGPRPAADRVGDVARRPVPGEGPGRVAPVLRGLRRDALGRERSSAVPGRRPGALRASARGSATWRSDHVQLRVDYWLHALDPPKVYGLGYGQLAQGQFATGIGRPRRHGSRPGVARA